MGRKWNIGDGDLAQWQNAQTSIKNEKEKKIEHKLLSTRICAGFVVLREMEDIGAYNYGMMLPKIRKVWA